MTDLGPGAEACLQRTRSSVLNLLVVVGLGIAMSGLILRQRDQLALFRAGEELRKGLMGGLLVVVVASTAARRILASRVRLRDPETRWQRFYIAHVVSAGIGALALPLGLAYGWLFQPRLGAVAPFWVFALGLGLISFPRRYELEGFEDGPDPGTAQEEPKS